jgi:hypothetical protein
MAATGRDRHARPLEPVGQQAQWVLEGTNAKLVETKLIRESGSETLKKKQLFEGQEKLKFLGRRQQEVLSPPSSSSKTRSLGSK